MPSRLESESQSSFEALYLELVFRVEFFCYHCLYRLLSLSHTHTSISKSILHHVQFLLLELQ
jgi:hypothetical protein